MGLYKKAITNKIIEFYLIVFTEITVRPKPTKPLTCYRAQIQGQVGTVVFHQRLIHRRNVTVKCTGKRLKITSIFFDLCRNSI